MPAALRRGARPCRQSSKIKLVLYSPRIDDDVHARHQQLRGYHQISAAKRGDDASILAKQATTGGLRARALEHRISQYRPMRRPSYFRHYGDHVRR